MKKEKKQVGIQFRGGSLKACPASGKLKIINLASF